MNSKKKVLLLIPNLGYGGAQRVFYDHSLELGKVYEIYEAVFNINNAVVFKSDKQLFDLNVPGGKNIFMKLYYFILRCIKLKRLKNRYKFDICISHLEGADYVNILTKGKERVFLCVHGSKLHDANIKGIMGFIRKKLLIPYLYNKADKIITVSHGIKDELSQHFRIKSEKLKVINNFFNIEKILLASNQPLPDYKAIFNGVPVLISAGRLANEKNYYSLLVIFRELLNDVPSKLVMVGDGELKESLIQYSKSLGLKTFSGGESPFDKDYHVYFLGFHANPFNLIKHADVFVFPSSQEGFPMALCEAMVCGAPVVASDCPTGPREILAPKDLNKPNTKVVELGEYGILMPIPKNNKESPDTKDWVETLKMVLSNVKVRRNYVAQGMERVNDFKTERIIGKWIKEIESAF